MAKTTHKYNNGEVTIVWKPEICIHSTLCWKGLREVFDPSKRPGLILQELQLKKLFNRYANVQVEH